MSNDDDDDKKHKNYRFTRKGVPSYSENPWAQDLATTVKQGNKITGFATNRHALINQNTGEMSGDMAVVGVQKVVDKEEFVKFFGAGIVEVFDLTKTGKDLFKAILWNYLDNKMQPDKIYINYAALKEDYGYSKTRQTFSNGLAELLQKGFLAPVENRENLYWVNPHLFYKGDRIRLIKEYVREGTQAHEDVKAEQQALEGQQLGLSGLDDENT